MSEYVISVTDDNFTDEVLRASIPVLVDYWNEWCIPCESIATTLDEIAETYTDKIKIVKLNSGKNPNITSKYGVRGFPTLMLFVNEEVIASKVGAISKPQLTAWLASLIA
ncbi:thioredoxin domain-containing protein [Thiotrichales bacterium HSG1]|nr:thioredoxin domain-containing protein [Thiotrichales bacterium HSG1]